VEAGGRIRPTLGKLVNRSGRTAHVQIELFDRSGALYAIAQATPIEQRSKDE
jgi:hypothetical protein